MKAVVLFPFPVELDGVSLQGHFLCNGLNENGDAAKACDFKASFEKKWLYKNFNPDVVIGIGFWGNTPQIIMEPKESGMQAVPWLNADGWVANYHDLLNSLPLIMVTSNWVKETYVRDGVSGKNIFPMPIGIDTNQMKPIGREDERVKQMRKMLGVKEDELMILTIGGDTTSKGFQEVMKALGKIDKELPKWKYVGKCWETRQPPYHYKEEAKIIKEFGFKKKVKFIDGSLTRESMCVLLNACDIYAAPSRIEGFGMIQVEAMSCGKPVLSIDAMGVKDTVVHNKTGFLAKVGEKVMLEEEWAYKSMGFKKKIKIKFKEPKLFGVRADIDDLAEHLAKLMGSEELRKEIGANGREHAVKNFDYKKTAKDISNLIKEKVLG